MAKRIAPQSKEKVAGKRRVLTKYEYALIFLQQSGLCGCGCGERLEAGQVDEEHTIPNAIKPGKPDALWRRECHKQKTKRDAAVIAKTKRLAGETGQTRTKRKIQSRGFDGTLSRGFDGKVRRK